MVSRQSKPYYILPIRNGLAPAVLVATFVLMLSPAVGHARDRKPFERLSTSDRSDAESCQEFLKAIATSKDSSSREKYAKQLLEFTTKLNSSEPNYFRAWVWRAQAALVLGLKKDALQALENMTALGVEKNKDPRVLGVVLAIEKRGWTSEDEENTADTSTEDTPSSSDSSPYEGERYPQTRTHNLSVADISSLSAVELRYAINEMYARHGMGFRDKSYQEQFERFSWYKPDPDLTMEQVESTFSDIETANVKTLGERRNALLH